MTNANEAGSGLGYASHILPVLGQKKTFQLDGFFLSAASDKILKSNLG